MDERVKPLGYYLDTLLTHKGKRRIWLAEVLNVSPATITRLYNDKAALTPEMAVRLEMQNEKVGFAKKASRWMACYYNYKIEQERDKLLNRKIHGKKKEDEE